MVFIYKSQKYESSRGKFFFAKEKNVLGWNWKLKLRLQCLDQEVNKQVEEIR